MAFGAVLAHVWGMSGLTPLETCLAQALDGTAPVRSEPLGLAQAPGHVLAEDLVLPHDVPTAHEALRAGFAVRALDLMGAGPALPIPLSNPHALLPGQPLPPGTDAILTEEGTPGPGHPAAIHPPAPGEGVRRAGHDGREGDILLRAGQHLGARQVLLAQLAGAGDLPVRRPRVHLMPGLALADHLAAWVRSLGARITGERPDLTIRPAPRHQPRLALAPGDTAWLAREGGALMLDLPPRFDAALGAFLALGLPALAALAGAAQQPVSRPVSRKIASTIGLSDLVLLERAGAGWLPGPAGTLTLALLARAEAFALIPPGSEGIAAGTPLPGLRLDNAFG